MVTAVQHHLAGAVTLGDVSCGMHAVAYLDVAFNEADVVHQAHKLGMAVAPLTQHYASEPKQAGLVLGFTDLPPEAIEKHIAKLARAILR